MLYGHSGRVIETDDDLHMSHSIANTFLNKVLGKTSQDRCIPALLSGCQTYWSSMEIPMQLHDPDGTIFNALSKAKHKKIRKPILIVDGQSIRFEGSHIGLSVYRKDIQLAEKYNHTISAEDQNILRLEAWLRGKPLRTALGLTDDRYRIRSFGIADLYKVFRHVMSGIEGAYWKPTSAAPANSKSQSKYIALGLACGMIEGSVEQQIKLYAEANGSGKTTTDSMKTEIRKLLESMSKIKLDVLFPETLPPNCQMNPTRQYEDKSLPEIVKPYLDTRGIKIDPRVKESYTKVTLHCYNRYKHSYTYNTPSRDLPPDQYFSEIRRRK